MCIICCVYVCSWGGGGWGRGQNMLPGHICMEFYGMTVKVVGESVPPASLLSLPWCSIYCVLVYSVWIV